MAIPAHRMALSLLSSSSSSSISYSIPLFSSYFRHQKRQQFAHFAFWNRNWNGTNGVKRSKSFGLSIPSSAVATDSSGSSLSTLSAQEEVEEGVPPETKITLPTNESSERLLRIRHTI